MSVAVLQNIFRREGRSLLQYVSEAYPWTRAGEQKPLAELHKMIAEEGQANADLATFLRRRHVPLPYLGAYPDFTTVNYVRFDFLLPRLVEAQRQGISALEHDLASLTDAVARQEVEKILELKRRHLQKLEELAAPAPAGA